MISAQRFTVLLVIIVFYIIESIIKLFKFFHSRIVQILADEKLFSVWFCRSWSKITSASRVIKTFALSRKGKCNFEEDDGYQGPIIGKRFSWMLKS